MPCCASYRDRDTDRGVVERGPVLPRRYGRRVGERVAAGLRELLRGSTRALALSSVLGCLHRTWGGAGGNHLASPYLAYISTVMVWRKRAIG